MGNPDPPAAVTVPVSDTLSVGVGAGAGIGVGAGPGVGSAEGLVGVMKRQALTRTAITMAKMARWIIALKLLAFTKP
jgi:hypothetical protein